MLSRIRRFVVVSGFLTVALAMSACGTPSSAPVAPAATVAAPTIEAAVEATSAPTEAAPTVEPTEEATTAATEAMTDTVEATEVMTETAEATTAATEAMTTTEATAPTTEAMTGTAVAEFTINVGDSSLGKILIGEAGRTLYVFKNDSAGTSNCYEGCAQNWPPVLTTGSPQAGTDADGALLGTIERTDGTTQVTYKGMPLYYFARDTAAGDVNGQGVGEVWYVVTRTGEMIE